MSGRRTPAIRPITGADLYGPSGRPHGADIAQGALGDCYAIATFGQYAERQPDAIRNAIHYDDKTRSFGVSLHDASGQARTIAVTQDDLRQDRAYGQGGGVNSPAYWSSAHHAGHSAAPAWPTVMEVAYAKLNAVSPTATTNADLAHIGGGGWPRDPIHALTGQSGTREVPAAQLRDQNKVYDLLSHAIHDGSPILLVTNPMKDTPHDGLVKGEYYGPNSPKNSGHAYMLEGVGRDRNGDVTLTLRNPWGHNNYPTYGVSSDKPEVHVSLKTILDNGHLENVTVGPAARRVHRATQADGQLHGTRQEAAPAATPPDPRSYWAAVAARSPDAARNASAEAQNIGTTQGQRQGRSP